MWTTNLLKIRDNETIHWMLEILWQTGKNTPLCTTDSITLGGAPDVAAAPVLPPSNPSYTFSRFLLIASYSFFFHKCWALMLFSNLFLIFHFFLSFSFVGFFLSECIFLFRTFIFGNHEIDSNYIFDIFDTFDIWKYILLSKIMKLNGNMNRYKNLNFDEIRIYL